MSSVQATKTSDPSIVKTIDVYELKELMDGTKQFQLIDCREPDEYEFCNIGGELIPVGEIESSLDRIRKDIPVVVQCRSGARSGRVVQVLQQRYGFTNLHNLEGGILAWSDEIDPDVPKY